jgi:hypothetical protein
MSPILIFFIILAVGAVLVAIFSLLLSKPKDYRTLAGCAFIVSILGILAFGSL